MTKNIVWRLKEQPSSESLRELVKDNLLTKDEAREILFSRIESEAQGDGRDNESLKAEIKFLRELVEKLSNRTQIVEVIKEVYKPYYSDPWYGPYMTWCNVGTSGTTTYTNATGGSIDLTGTATTSAGAITQNCSFSDIKTF